MASNPKRLEKSLSSGYHMEIDLRKSDCNRERTPHWHLAKGGTRYGSISAYGEWIQQPPKDVPRSVVKEAEDLTRTYSSDIKETYEYNRENGSDY